MEYGNCMGASYLAILTGEAPGLPSLDRIPEDQIHLVHGTANVTEPGTRVKKRGDHAWVEISAPPYKVVYDSQLGRVMEWEEYRARTGAVAHHKYTRREAVAMYKECQHTGPWQGRGEKNPPHFADGSHSISWGLISPEGKVQDARGITDPTIYSHDKLAITLGFRSAYDAIAHGWTRYAVFTGHGGVVRLIGTAGPPWSRAAGHLQKVMGQYPVESLALDLLDKHGDRKQTIGVDGEAKVVAQLRELARTRNPDWSRESMKTILAWGWVSPTGQDHIGRRKDGTHDRMAYDLGLGTWIQAVKAGWVRYIIFSDGHMGLTLIPTPNTLISARRLVQRPEVITASFEWMVDGKLEQSGALTAKEAVAAIRAKGRVSNPPYHGGGDDAGTVFSWGFLSPRGRVIDGAKEEFHKVITHDLLAKSEGLVSEAKALGKGYVRYLTGTFGTTGAKVEISATIAEPWAAPAKVLWGYIERGLGGKSAGLMYLDFTEANGKQHYASIALIGEERMKAVLSAVARGEDPANVTERERKRSAGREENPSHHADSTGQGLPWGFIVPGNPPTIISGLTTDMELDERGRGGHTELLLKLTREGVINAGGTMHEGRSWGSIRQAVKAGWIRYVVYAAGRGTYALGMDFIPQSAKYALWYLNHLEMAVDEVYLGVLVGDNATAYTSYAHVDGTVKRMAEVLKRIMRGEDVLDAIGDERQTSRTANPLTLTDTHRSQARGNKFNILVEMTPMEFLRLTTVDDRQIKEIMDQAKPLSVYNDAARDGRNIIPCFLTLDIASGQAKVMGHEGRHRAAALFLNGEEGVGLPVYLRIADAHPGQAQKMLAKLPGGEKQWMWDTTYLWGWDELPDMLIGQFNRLAKVPKGRLKVVEKYVQSVGRKARGL